MVTVSSFEGLQRPRHSLSVAASIGDEEAQWIAEGNLTMMKMTDGEVGSLVDSTFRAHATGLRAAVGSLFWRAHSPSDSSIQAGPSDASVQFAGIICGVGDSRASNHLPSSSLCFLSAVGPFATLVFFHSSLLLLVFSLAYLRSRSGFSSSSSIPIGNLEGGEEG
ncbi:hypothetical protein ZIOFF_048532 [Zingiber officinale]|uniref:Uncharacterized protein n=1 Tax=Zingiber officinale TaxID=94328 RepID=A0A8J5G7W1_ZINOF|nr:hypothetical protein ZIOFF_048532 [Zingiber officinale]